MDSKNNLVIEVFGRPAPQGSKKSIGHNRFVETSKYLPAWRSAVSAAARAAVPEGFEPWDCPVALEMLFFIERPKNPKFGWPAVAPDASKLQRAVEDALTGIVWVDDSRIVKWIGKEVWCGEDTRLEPGCLLKIYPL